MIYYTTSFTLMLINILYCIILLSSILFKKSFFSSNWQFIIENIIFLLSLSIGVYLLFINVNSNNSIVLFFAVWLIANIIWIMLLWLQKIDNQKTIVKICGYSFFISGIVLFIISSMLVAAPVAVVQFNINESAKAFYFLISLLPMFKGIHTLNPNKTVLKLCFLQQFVILTSLYFSAYFIVYVLKNNIYHLGYFHYLLPVVAVISLIYAGLIKIKS